MKGSVLVVRFSGEFRKVVEVICSGRAVSVWWCGLNVVFLIFK